MQGDDGGVSGAEYDEWARSACVDEYSGITGSQGESSGRDDVKGEQFHMMSDRSCARRMSEQGSR